MLEEENIKLKQEIAQLTRQLQALSVTLWENSTRREEVERLREAIDDYFKEVERIISRRR